MQATHSKSVAHTPDCCPCRPPRQPFTSAFPAPRQKRSIQSHRHHELYCQHRADSAATDHTQHHQQPMYHISAEVPRPGAPPADPSPPAALPYMAAAAGVALTFFALKRVFDTPSRAYKENVGDEYDSWTEDGVLEYYWGEHIHLGYYTGKQTFHFVCTAVCGIYCPSCFLGFFHIYLACDSSVLSSAHAAHPHCKGHHFICALACNPDSCTVTRMLCRGGATERLQEEGLQASQAGLC